MRAPAAIHTSVSSVADGGENYAFDGNINVPLIEDKLGLRIAAYYGSISGIYDRVYEPNWLNYQTGETVQGTTPAFDTNKDVDDEDYYGTQIAMKWMPTDNLSITPKFMYQKIKADGLPFADVDAENMETRRFFDADEPGEDEWWIASVVVNWSINAGDITSTTAMYERDTSEFERRAYLPRLYLWRCCGNTHYPPLESVLETTSEYENITHETRFTSNLRWATKLHSGILLRR